MLRFDSEKLLLDNTSLRIGGTVYRWLEPNSHEEILDAISFAENINRPLMIIGRGCNILASDKGFDGVVIKLGPAFDYIKEIGDGVFDIGASTDISKLVKQGIEYEVTGCEFLSGIPGSFGGAIFMNAGVRDFQDKDDWKEVKDIIVSIDILDFKDKHIYSLRKEDIPFTYRSCGLTDRCILSGRIKLQKCDKKRVAANVESFIKSRDPVYKISVPSAGSVFKNPLDRKESAGMLIEKCGLKGSRIGGAEISKVHANFIVNVGGATSKDVLSLIDLARKKVKQQFGIELELELRLL